jgi:hypothetical protein
MTDATRAGIVSRPVSYLIFAATLVLAVSCYSTSYQREMAANTDLMAGLADKLGDYCAAGFTIGDRQVSSEEMGEFYYALKKARAFATMQRTEANRASYRDFVILLDQYSAFLHAADEYRLAGREDPGKVDGLNAQRDAIKKTASRVQTDLKSEQ